MNLKIKRRRFSQLALASATVTVVTNLTGKTAAQSSSSLLGVRFTSSRNKASKEDTTDTTDLANTAPAITLVSLEPTVGEEISTTDIISTKVDNIDAKTEAASKAVYTKDYERITGFTVLSDGTLILVTVALSKKGNYSKLLYASSKSSKFKKSKKISGFKKNNSTIENVLATKDDKIIGVVSHNGGTPPFELVIIDPKNGKLLSKDELALPELSPDIRFSNLALAPDGKIYATILGHEGILNLVQLDPQQRSIITGKLLITKVAELNYNKEFLSDDLFDLTVSSLGQFIALANPKKEKTNSLFSVNIKTGEMTLISKVAVDKIAFY